MEKKSTFRIKEMRNGRHLTQEELGEIIGVSQQTFSRYEKQEVLMPVDVLVRLSRYFNVSTDYLLGLTDVHNVTVLDNLGRYTFENANKNDYTRYNFEAKPYNSFSANGGHRHHFIPAASLNANGFNSDTAYCIRMMVADHQKTGSFGSSSYVANITNLLSSRKYQEALQTEVNDLQSKYDSEGIAGNLQQKYYYEVVTCLYQYEILFGIN